MASDAVALSGDGSEVLDRWLARNVQPVVVLYLVAVFAALIAVSHFVFDSAEAVKALVIAAVGTVGATLPSILGKVEYQATASGIEKRKVDEKKPREFEEAFSWDELSHVVPIKHGFRYFKELDETRSLRRFWKLHVSDQHSGVIHVEKLDLERVLGLVKRQEITVS
jgi:hypothetical protein